MSWQGATTIAADAGREGQQEADDPARAALWTDFETPPSAEVFFRAWLAIQCGLVADAIAGVLLIGEAEGQYAVVATWPNGSADVADLVATARLATAQRRSLTHHPPGTAGRVRQTCVACPIEIDDLHRAVVAVQIAGGIHRNLQSTMHRLRWGCGWLEARLRERQAEDREASIRRMTFAMNILADASEGGELYGSVAAIVNELAVRLACERVSIGIVRRSRMRLVAMSHTAIFDERTNLVETIENAMEEAWVQKTTIALPSTSLAERRVCLAHKELMRISASTSVASVVMTAASRTIGVITLERESGAGFDLPTIQLLEVVAHLLGPLVEMKADRQRILGGRLVEAAGSAVATLTGRRRPAIKVAIALLAGLVAYAVLAQADFRVSGKAVVEGSVQRAAVAPFEGFVESAPVKAGDVVATGQLLASLDNRELTLDMLRARSDYNQQIVKYNDAMGQRDAVAARLAAALIEQSKAELAEAEERLDRAKITAPFAGIVVSGDLRQMLGSPVNKGQVLFQLAPLHSFRVTLQIDERDISFVSTGQKGELVLTGISGHSFPFLVKSVIPVANAAEGRNFFAVEADIQDPSEQLRPGMEGIGKVMIERRRLLWIWTRPLTEWATITAWKWAL
jgi:multidrug efflux pump subunit AcrA (membrane-fusion protein)